MKKIIILSIVLFSAFGLFVLSTNAAKPSDYGLKEGDLISAIFSDDPDVYIINEDGYKRLFLNPEIFKFYSHLGGFVNVKLVTTEVRDAFITSGLFRNCEDNDQKVYGVDIDGEDSGKLRWVNVSGDAAISEDANFFKKVFCVNRKEFKWYPIGSEFKAVKEVPKYERMEAKETVTTEKKIETNAPLKIEGKVIVCHYPSEAPNKFQEITIAASALKTHLEHGDSIGICSGAVLSPTPTPSVTPISISVVSPNGGEVFQKGTTQIIKWNAINVSKVYIKLGKGNDTYHGSEGMITDVIPNVDGYYKWTVPMTLPDGNDYYIRIVDGNNTGIYDDNNAPFSIVTTAIQTPVPSITPVPSVSAAPPTPTPIPTPTSSPSVSPTPSVTPTPSPSATPTPTPATSVSAPASVTIGWYKGFNGQPPVGTYQMAISFLYASNVSDVQSFRLYLKKPGESSFSAVATFANPASINSTCSGYIYSGTWRMRNCITYGGGSWQIFSSLGAASSYAVGEYNAYITAVNNSGIEGPVSSTAKNIVSKTAILSPIGVQNLLTPQFRWTVPNSWPGGLFNLQVYDGSNYVWGYGGFSIAAGTAEGSYTYNGPPLTSPYFGPALSPSKTYYVNIWAEGSDSNGTRNFSMGDSNPSFTVSSAPTPTPIACTPIIVSISPATPSSQNASSGQDGVPIVIFNIVANCNLSLNSFAVSLLPMPSGYQNISSLRLYNNATEAQLGSTITASVAGLNFTGLSQPILANQILSLKVAGDISPSAVIGSTVYGVFGGSSATDTAGTFVGNNASGNLIAGNTTTIVASVANANQPNILAAFSRNLTVGSIGDDVKQLQTLLVKEVNYSTNLITGYFGRITRDAVKKLQAKYSVSPASGFFGEITRKTLNAAILN